MFDDAREQHDFEAEIERSLRRTISDFMREGGIPLPFLSHVAFGWVDHQMALDVEFRYSNGHRALMRYYVRWRHGPGHFSQSPLTFVDQIARRYSTLANDAVPGMVFATAESFPVLSYSAMEAAAFEMRTTPWLEAAEQHWRERNDPYHSRMARMAPPPVQQPPYRYQTQDRGYVGLGNIHVQSAPVPQMAQSQALRKSLVLLMENLTERQKKDFLQSGYFDVTGQSGWLYRIYYGSAMNIVRMTKDHVPVDCNNLLCVVPEGGLPVGDVLLCQKLGLELEEALAIKRGNWFSYHDGLFHMMRLEAQHNAEIVRRMLNV